MARWKHSTGCRGVSLRGQTYYARYTIPKDVRDKLGGRTERWQSLKTSDLREARSRADLLIARWKAEVAEARGDQAAEQRIKEWQSVRIGYVEARELWTQAEADKVAAAEFLQKRIPEVGKEAAFLELNEQTNFGTLSEGLSAYLEDFSFEHGEAATHKLIRMAKGLEAPTLLYLEEWLQKKQQDGLTPRSIKQIETNIRRMAKVFPMVPIQHADVRLWVDELESKGMATDTLNSHISNARTYYDYLQLKQVVDGNVRNPFEGRTHKKKRARKVEDQRRAFTEDEVVILVRAAMTKKRDPNLLNAITIAAYTGMRREEIAALKVEHVKKSGGIKYFTVVKAKTGAGLRDVPVSKQIENLVDELLLSSTDGYLLPGEPTTGNGERGDALGKRFSTLKKKLGFGKQHVFHSIRKTVCTMFEQADVNKDHAAEVVGHEKTGMTYGHYSEGRSLRQKADVVEKLSYSELEVDSKKKPQGGL